MAFNPMKKNRPLKKNSINMKKSRILFFCLK